MSEYRPGIRSTNGVFGDQISCRLRWRPAGEVAVRAASRRVRQAELRADQREVRVLHEHAGVRELQPEGAERVGAGEQRRDVVRVPRPLLQRDRAAVVGGHG
jgi:hypothetical protein